MLIRRPVPDSDWILSSQDFRAGELVTHGQSCIWLLGESELARALLTKDETGQSIDPHAALAATVLGVDYATFIAHKKELLYKNARQASKPPNFGYPGGMGDAKLVLQQRKQGPDTPCPGGPSMVKDADGNLVPGFKGLRFCILMDGAPACGIRKRTTWGHREQRIPPTCEHCLECAARLKIMWKRQWPENERYFKLVSEWVDEGFLIRPEALDRWPWLRPYYRPWQRLAPGEVMLHVSGIIRQVSTATKESPFCSAANGMFQGLLAVIAKEAHRQCSRECHDSTYRVPTLLHENSLPSAYAGGQSPLYGSHIPAFQHDEMLGEHPRSVAHEGAMRISEVMRDKMRYRCQDVADAAEAEPTLMPRWYKSATKVVHADRLVPWTPEHNEKKCPDCAAQKARDDARKAQAVAA
jgi:hypothetical protein